MEVVLSFLILVGVAVPIILLIVLTNKINAVTARVRWLEKEMLHLRTGITPRSAPVEPLVVPADPTIVEIKTPQSSPPVPSSATLTPQPDFLPPVPVAEERSPAREEWEAFVGGKLLNRIGALALTIGVAFFLKYAFDNNWISETMRVLIGVVAGLALLVLGARSHRKAFPVFAQGLIGAGVAILYLSVFATFNYYHLVSQLTAIVLMSVVTVIAFHQAFRYDSQAISLLGLAGGFLTPFLLSAGVPNETGLFFYLGVLETGLLAVVILRQRWTLVELFTFLGTYLIFGLWHGEYYVVEALLPTVLFLALFWTLFYLADFLRIYTNAGPDPVRQIINVANAGLFYLYLYLLINPQHHEIMGMLTVIFASLYVLPAVLTARKDPRSTNLRDYILTTAILLVIATSVQFSNFITIALWAGEALVFVWCARQWGYRFLAGAALLFLAVIFIRICATKGAFGFTPIEEFTPVFNNRFLAIASLSASMGVGAILLKNTGIRGEESYRVLLHSVWTVLIFALLTTETVDYFATFLRGATVDIAIRLEFAREMALLAVWIVYSLPLIYAGLKANSSPVLISGLFLTGTVFLVMVVWGISFTPIENFSLLLNVRAATVALVLAGSMVSARWLRGARATNESAGAAYPVILTGQALLLLLLLTSETRDLFEQKLFMLTRLDAIAVDKWRSMENMKQLSLSGLWLFYGIALMIGGIWRRIRGLRILAIVILCTAILKIFIYDLSFLETFYRIFSFIGLGLILLAASYLYQRYKSLIIDDVKKTESV